MSIKVCWVKIGTEVGPSDKSGGLVLKCHGNGI